jgi:spore maturation protein CgeB
MRFLIVSADYPDYLHSLYGTHPGLAEQSYAGQVRARVESLQGSADFYAKNLRALGHEAWVVWPNNKFMQSAWARENGVRVESPTARSYREAAVRQARRMPGQGLLRYLKPVLRPLLGSLNGERWLYDILTAQIKACQPEVLLNQAVDSLSNGFFREMKPHAKLLVGQVACMLPVGVDLHGYDLMISSLPNLVRQFREIGLPVALNRLAFEPAVLDRLERPEQEIPVSFVGSFTRGHTERVRLLEYLCERSEIMVWGSRVNRLPPSSSIKSRYGGPAWGIHMYRLLRASKITVNNHEAWAGLYANNMRLFEATGVGTLLVTDWKANLHEMFETGKEVVTYRRPEECAELVQHYLHHERERQDIARAGQQRTLREHTYYQRMQELVDIVESRMSARRALH